MNVEILGEFNFIISLDILDLLFPEYFLVDLYENYLIKKLSLSFVLIISYTKIKSLKDTNARNSVVYKSKLTTTNRVSRRISDYIRRLSLYQVNGS